MSITVSTIVDAPMDEVWRRWINPADIMQWNAASDDWHTTQASVDFKTGGAFSSRMEAKDGSMGFDFKGTYTKIVPHQLIETQFGDRTATVRFQSGAGGITVTQIFDPEDTHSAEKQRAGWQAILDRFAAHVRACQPT